MKVTERGGITAVEEGAPIDQSVVLQAEEGATCNILVTP